MNARLQQAYFFASKSLTTMLTVSVITSTLLKWAVSFASFFAGCKGYPLYCTTMCEIKKLSRLNLLEIFHIIALYSLFLLFKMTNFCMWSDYPFILWGKINSISDLFHSWLCYWLHLPSHIFVVLKLTKWIKCLLNQ